MSTDQNRPDSRLKNVAETADASVSKDADKLVEVKKDDSASSEDKESTINEQPSDEQMHQTFEDIRKEKPPRSGD